MNRPITMLSRPLDVVFGPPDPEARMVPVVTGRAFEDAIWLSPAYSSCGVNWHVNPGHPGHPERLPWKRAAS